MRFFSLFSVSVSAPIAKNIMKSIISIKNIEPSRDVTPREYTWLDTKYIKCPNLMGMTLEEAKKSSKGFNLEYSGNGDKIIYQEPEPGLFIKENSTIKVLIN